uniref:TIR domain n=2 Tax=Schistocephalus solidus TaxID=70667 RepID=A0A0X3P4K2_SCHSO
MMIRRWILSRRQTVLGANDKTVTGNLTSAVEESKFMLFLLERISMEINFEEKLLERMTLQTHHYNTVPHVMISYNRFYRNLANELANRLREAGFKVWLDIEQSIPAGNPLENLLTAIEQSFAVCAVFSELYEQSQSTRAEAKYASRLGKPFIFCRAQKNYSPNGWLKDMMKNAEAVTFEFSSKRISEPPFEDVRRKLEGYRAEYMRKMRDDCTSRSIVMLYSTPTDTKEVFNESLTLDRPVMRGDIAIAGWNATKVKEWMNDHMINWQNTENLNGQDLCFLKRLRNEAPEFFYKMASEKWQITSVSALRRLTNSLESL